MKHTSSVYEVPHFCQLIITGLPLLSACKKDIVKTNTEIELRVLNKTPAIIYNCIVNPGALSGSYNFGQVAVDSVSNYKIFDRGYSYGYLSLTLNNNTYALQPFDYVGETPLENGKYTYKITFSPPNDLRTTLIKD